MFSAGWCRNMSFFVILDFSFIIIIIIFLFFFFFHYYHFFLSFSFYIYHYYHRRVSVDQKTAGRRSAQPLCVPLVGD